ncbi:MULTISPECIES: XdhC family protein [unclassified Gordonia (in: high G+C Gram-positive bacteria)]|uniref:XdhC family protein n=1 Tax=unclassified Gordonia (in: high G+C Gram-positive bacteria) TaxID=2657482 RepID=UPI001F0EC269|nr:XdhC family protein [Gordonia sp. ABSL49_1]MCH5641198.1 XdhC family protein [Gordonia sp. ABSL49_1]
MPSEPRRLTDIAAQFISERVPFARATVVRAQPPTSAHAGDFALVTADGRIDGFIGGQCARESVRLAATDVINAGEGMLLRIVPDGGDPFPETPGARVAVNPCMSGGALEVFVEPVLPAPILHVAGDTPIATAVAEQARLLGLEVTQPDSSSAALATIVCTHGGDEAGLIRSALEGGVGFIGLVASRTRGAAVLDSMELTPAQRDLIHTPVGLDIGAVTPAEIALSILAQVVAAVRRDGLRTPRIDADDASAATPPAQRHEVDPICGMTVVVAEDTPGVSDESGQHWFCCAGCLEAYLARTSGDLQAMR